MESSENDIKPIFIKEEYNDDFEFVDFVTQSNVTSLVKEEDRSQDINDFDASIKVEEHGVQVFKVDTTEETTAKEIESVFLPEQPFNKSLRLSEPSTSGTTINKIQKQRKINHVPTKMSWSEFVKCCVGLVTVKNIPFRIFDDEQFFKKLILPYEEQFNINMNSKNIVKNVNLVSDKICQIISTFLHNKMICLKLDLAARMDETILGINVQYIKDFEICVDTIGMIRLKKNHTGQFLQNEILNCFKKFNINAKQIYSFTNDDGANLLKTSESLRELQEDAETHSNMETESPSDEYEEIHHRLKADFPVIRCVAHIIQSTAQDVLKTIQSNVEECRNTIKALRITAQGDESNITLPRIDNITRWNSTFEMIYSLYTLRDSINNAHDRSRIPIIDWNFVAEFIEAFQPLVECSKRVQSEQYIIGDFYRDLLCCEIELEELINKNTYASRLSEVLKQRKDSLLNNDVFISAIYLDPRFNFLNSPFFTEDEKRVSVKHLLRLYDIIKDLSGELQDVVNTFDYRKNASSSGTFSKLENMVDRLIDMKTSKSTEKNMQQTLENLAYAERVPFDTDILEYWKHRHHRDPELGNLIQVAFAIPCTQASVERAFTALSVILNSDRSKLSQQTIDNLLLVKLNSHLLTEISLQD